MSRARALSPGPRGPATRRGLLRQLAAVAAPLLLASSVGVFHVWSRTRALAEGYRLAAVQGERSRLVSEHDRLLLEVEAIRAPRALENFARTRLGMAPPDPGPVWAGRASGGDDHLSGPAGPALSSSPPGALAMRAPARGPSRGGPR
jgi:cell division protein FtsL